MADPNSKNNTKAPTKFWSGIFGGWKDISTISSKGGGDVGNKVNSQINNYSQSNINPATGIPYGAKGTPDFYVDAVGNWHRGDNYAGPNGVLNTENKVTNYSSGGGGSPQKKSGGAGPQPSSGNPPSYSQTPEQNLEKVPEYAPTPEGTAYLNSLNNYQAQIQGLMSSVDQNFNNELAQINAQMGMIKSKQTQENDMYARGVKQAGLASGMSEITPEIMKGEVHQAVNEGLQKLTDLTVQQNGLILDARKANITQKMDILKQLEEIDAQKYAVARQMKDDFYNNIKKQDELVQSKVSDILPSIYSEIQNLPPEMQSKRLMEYAKQMGVPVSQFAGLYQKYNEEEQKPIRDMRAKLMEMAPDVGWSQGDLTLPPAEFQKKLASSPYFKAQMYSQTLDNLYKQAQINKINSEGQASAPMVMSGLNYGKNIGFIPKGGLTADQQKIVDAVNNTGQIVKETQKMWYNAFPNKAKTATGGAVGGVLESRFLDQDYKQYYDQVRGVASILAKVYGNTGNPSDKDIKNAINLFPSKYDTQATADAKWKSLYDTAMNRLSNYGDVYIVTD